MFFNIVETKFHQKPHLLDEKQQFIKVSCIPWSIKNPSNWSDHNRRCEIGTKRCIFSAWRYLSQRLAISRQEIGVISPSE